MLDWLYFLFNMLDISYLFLFLNFPLWPLDFSYKYPFSLLLEPHYMNVFINIVSQIFYVCFIIFLFSISFPGLGIKSKVSYMQDKFSAIELHSVQSILAHYFILSYPEPMNSSFGFCHYIIESLYCIL